MLQVRFTCDFIMATKYLLYAMPFQMVGKGETWTHTQVILVFPCTRFYDCVCLFATFPNVKRIKTITEIFSVLPLHYPALWSQGKDLNPHISLEMRSNRYMQCRLCAFQHTYIINYFGIIFNIHNIQTFMYISVSFTQYPQNFHFCYQRLSLYR